MPDNFMKTIATALLAAALTSCGFDVPLPDGTTARTTVGYYAPSNPSDPNAKLGAFTERIAQSDPEPVIAPAK